MSLRMFARRRKFLNSLQLIIFFLTGTLVTHNPAFVRSFGLAELRSSRAFRLVLPCLAMFGLGFPWSKVRRRTWRRTTRSR